MENEIEELTAKNREYFHAITKQLMLSGKSDEEVKTILNEVLPQIIEGQKTDTPARKLLGTPTEFVAKYTPKAASKDTKTDKNTNENPVLMWLDGTLLFFGVIYLMSGILGFFSKNSQVYGLLTAFVMAALAGLVMYLIYRYYYKQEAGKRKWNWKSLLLIVVIILVWSGFSMFSLYLPRIINPVFNPIVTLVIGVLSLVVKYLLKRQFHTRSALAPTNANTNARK